MNTSLLQELAAQNRAALLFFSVFAERYNSLKQPTIQQVIDIARRQNVSLSAEEIEEFFAGLEKANCGRFMPHADPSVARFAFIFKATEVSRAARGKTKFDLSKLAISTPPAPAATLAPPVEMILHSLRLRADLDVTLSLPTDLTENEAERLQFFVAALPLRDGDTK